MRALALASLVTLAASPTAGKETEADAARGGPPREAGSDPDASAQAQKAVFITSATFNGNLGGLAGADDKCNRAARAVNLGGTFKAWLSDSRTGPADRFTRSTVPYVRTDGTPIADDWDDLVDCSEGNAKRDCLDAPLTVDENGDAVTTFLVQAWSNTGTDGTPGTPLMGSGVNCADWTTSDPAVATWGATGQAKFGAPQLDADWTGTNGVADCKADYRLYCFQQ